MSGWWFQRFVMLFSIINIWDVNLPMDEVHHFQAGYPLVNLHNYGKSPCSMGIIIPTD